MGLINQQSTGGSAGTAGDLLNDIPPTRISFHNQVGQTGFLPTWL